MQLEDYFEFETFETKFGPVDRIRIKGHRIGIEHVVGFYKQGFSPETILRDVYPSLTIEKIYAVVLYYEANKERVEKYIHHSDKIGDLYYQEYMQQPETDMSKRLKAIKAARQAAETLPPCDRCGTPGSLGLGPRGFHWRCSSYPKCNWSKPLVEDEVLGLQDLLLDFPAWAEIDLPEITRRLRLWSQRGVFASYLTRSID